VTLSNAGGNTAPIVQAAFVSLTIISKGVLARRVSVVDALPTAYDLSRNVYCIYIVLWRNKRHMLGEAFSPPNGEQ
jgi:hypothetical protein